MIKFNNLEVVKFDFNENYIPNTNKISKHYGRNSNETGLPILYHGIIGMGLSKNMGNQSLENLLQIINNIDKEGLTQGYLAGSTKYLTKYGIFTNTKGELVINVLVAKNLKEQDIQKARTMMSGDYYAIPVKESINPKNLAVFYCIIPKKILNMNPKMIVNKKYEFQELNTYEKRMSSLIKENHNRNLGFYLGKSLVEKAMNNEILTEEEVKMVEENFSNLLISKKHEFKHKLLLFKEFSEGKIGQMSVEEYQGFNERKNKTIYSTINQTLEQITNWYEQK